MRMKRCREYLKGLYSDDSYLEASPGDFSTFITIQNSTESTITYRHIFSKKNVIPKEILRGGKGLGKTCLVNRLVREWTDNPGLPVPLLIDVKKINTPIALLDVLKSQVLSGCNIKPSGIYNMIKSNPKQFMLFLDGVDENMKEKLDEINRMISEDLVKDVGVFIFTSLPYNFFPNHFKSRELYVKEENIYSYAQTSKDKLETWKKSVPNSFFDQLPKEPLVLSLILEGINEKKQESASPKEMCEFLITSYLITNEKQYSEGIKEWIQYLALYNLILERNVFTLDKDEPSSIYLQLIYRQQSKLYKCRKKTMDGSDYYEIDFHSHLIQVYLSYLALISDNTDIKGMVEHLMKGDSENLLRKLSDILYSLEKIIPNDFTFASSSYHSLLALYAPTNLLDHVTHLLPDSDRQITGEMESFNRRQETEEKVFKSPLKYSLAIDIKSTALLGISTYYPKILLRHVVKKINDRSVKRKDVWVLAFTADQWKYIKAGSRLQTHLKDCNKKDDLTYTIDTSSQQYYKSERVAKEESNEEINGEANEEINEEVNEEVNSLSELRVYLQNLYRYEFQDTMIKAYIDHLKLKPKAKKGTGTISSYKEILASDQNTVCITGEAGSGKSCFVKKILSECCSSTENELTPLLLDVNMNNPAESIEEVLHRLHPNCHDLLNAHADKIVCIFDGIDALMEENPGNINQLIHSIRLWKEKLKIWIFARPRAVKLLTCNCKRYDLHADLSDYLKNYTKLSEPDVNSIEGLVNNNKELSILIPQEPLILSYLCKKAKEGVKFNLLENVFDSFIHEEVGDDEIKELEYIALCVLLLDRCNFSQSETNLDRNGKVISVNLDLIRGQDNKLYQCQDIDIADNSTCVVDFKSRILQVYLACSSLNKRNDPRIYDVSIQSNVVNLTTFYSYLKMFDPDLELFMNEKIPILAFSLNTKHLDFLISFLLESDQKEDTCICREMAECMKSIHGSKFSLALNMESKRLVGFSSLPHKELWVEVRNKGKYYAKDNPFLTLSFTDMEWEKTFKLESSLQTCFKKFKYESEPDFSADIIHLVGRCNKQERKEMLFVYGPMKTNDTTYNCINLYCDYGCLWVNGFVTKLWGEKLAHVTLDSYAGKLKDIELGQNLTSLDLSDILLNIDCCDELCFYFEQANVNQLETLKMGGCKLLSPKVVFKGLKNCTNIKHFDIRETYMADETIPDLVDFLSRNTQLQHLNVKSCRCSWVGMKGILNAIHTKNTSLAHLDIGYNCVPRDELAMVMGSLHSLTHLLLNSIKLKYKDGQGNIEYCSFNSLLTLLKNQGTITNITYLDLKNLPLHECEEGLFVVFPLLEHIFLNNAPIVVEEVNAMIQRMCDNNIRLKSLDLGNYPRTDIRLDMETFAVDAITHLDVGDCRILYDTLVICLKRCKSLTYLNISGNYIGNNTTYIDVMKDQLKNLEYLNVKDCRIGISGIKALSKKFENVNKLQYLDLSKNIFGYCKVTVAYLAKFLNDNLEYLVLEGCSLNVDSLLALGDNLITTRLKGLNLSDNIIYDKDSQALLKVLENKPRLERLMLDKYSTNDAARLLGQLEKMNIKDMDANYLNYEIPINKPLLAKMDNLERLQINDHIHLDNISQIFTDLSGKTRFHTFIYRYHYFVKLPTPESTMCIINDHFTRVFVKTEKGTLHPFVNPEMPSLLYEYGVRDGSKWMFKMKDNDFQFNTRFIKSFVPDKDRLSFEYAVTANGSGKKIDLTNCYNLQALELTEDCPPLHEHVKSSVRVVRLSKFESIKLNFTTGMKAITEIHLKDNTYANPDDVLELMCNLPMLSTFSWRCNKIPPRPKVSKLNRLKKLYSITLGFFMFEKNDIVQCIQQSPQINKFVLEDCEWNDSSLLGSILDIAKQLEHFKLTSLHAIWKQDDPLVDAFINKLKMAHTNLTSLSLAGQFSYSIILLANIETRKERRERTLYYDIASDLISKINLKAKGDRKTYATIKAFLPLKEKFSNLLQSLASDILTKLYIAEDLTDGGKVLTESLKDFPNVQELILKRLCINGKCLGELFQGIKSLKQLKTLDLSYNDVGMVDEAIAQETFSELNTLRELTLCFIRVKSLDWLKVITHAKNLKRLTLENLKFENISPAECKDLSRVFVDLVDHLKYLFFFQMTKVYTTELTQDKKVIEREDIEFKNKLRSNFKSRVDFQFEDKKTNNIWEVQQAMIDLNFYERILGLLE